MEPRARAGKNVGKMNFGYGELRQLLYGCGDTREPLPETMRLLDEIATDFIQGLSFEAARIAHYAGRQKIKYEDFEFALRRNPLFLGKVREMFEMSKEVKDARKMPGIGEGNLGKADVNELSKLGEVGDDAAGEAGGNKGTADGEGGGSGGGGADGTQGSSTAAAPQKRKYNKTGESKKKKKAKLAALAAAGKGGGDDGLFGDGAADCDVAGRAAGFGPGVGAGAMSGGGNGSGGDSADGRSSVAPASAVGADDEDDLADLDGDIDAELR